MYHSFVPAALRYIDQVARSGSVQGAARQLHVAASAINRQILQLEAELGTALFERMPRGMRLTSAGESIVTLARRWREDERRTVTDVRSLLGVNQGSVRLAVMDSHASSFMPALICDIARTQPMVSLSVEVFGTDAACTALHEGKVDVAAVFNHQAGPDMVELWRAELPLGCIVASTHPLAAQRTTSLNEALEHPVVIQSKSLAIRNLLEARHSWLFSGSRGRLETNSLHLVKQLVGSAGYLAFTSELDAAPELIEGSLRFVPVRDRGADPQAISVVVDARRPIDGIVRLVADQLCLAAQDCLARVRQACGAQAQRAPGPLKRAARSRKTR